MTLVGSVIAAFGIALYAVNRAQLDGDRRHLATNDEIQPTGGGIADSESKSLPKGLDYAQIIQNPACSASRSIQMGDDTFMAFAYEGADTRYVFVVGPDGVVDTIETDFRPNRIDVGRSSLGDTAVAYGDTRLGAKVRRDVGEDQPVRIYLNGVLEYSSDRALDFGVANDASSFFVIDSIGENQTRLITRSFTTGSESHYTLTGKVSGEAIEGNYSITIGNTSKTVALVPSADSGLPTIFYGLHEESQIELRPPKDLPIVSAMYANEEDAFFVIAAGGGKASMVRMRIDTSSTPFKIESLWTQDIPNIVLGGQTKLSPNGDWILVNGENIALLDAKTGERVFDWDMGKEKTEYLSRLQSVDPMALDEARDTGLIFGADFSGNHLVLDRRFGTREISKCQTGQSGGECVRKARENIKKAKDVFDLGTISSSSSPSFRIWADDSRNSCVGLRAVHRLEIEDGHLVTRNPVSSDE